MASSRVAAEAGHGQRRHLTTNPWIVDFAVGIKLATPKTRTRGEARPTISTDGTHNREHDLRLHHRVRRGGVPAGGPRRCHAQTAASAAVGVRLSSVTHSRLLSLPAAQSAWAGGTTSATGWPVARLRRAAWRHDRPALRSIFTSLFRLCAARDPNDDRPLARSPAESLRRDLDRHDARRCRPLRRDPGFSSSISRSERPPGSQN